MNKQLFTTIKRNKIKQVHKAFEDVRADRIYLEWNGKSLTSIILNRGLVFTSIKESIKNLLNGKDSTKIKLYDRITARKKKEYKSRFLTNYARSGQKTPLAYVFSFDDRDDVAAVVNKGLPTSILVSLVFRGMLSKHAIQEGIVYGADRGSITKFLDLELGIYKFLFSKPKDEATAAFIEQVKTTFETVKSGIIDQVLLVHSGSTDQCVDLEACIAGMQQVHDLCYSSN